MSKIIKIDLQKLEQEYLQENCTISQLANKYSCSESTISNKLKINNNEQVLNKMKNRIVTWKKSKKKRCCIKGCNRLSSRKGCCEVHYAKLFATKEINDYINKNKTNIEDVIIRRSNKFIIYNNFIVIEIYEKNKKDIKIKGLVSKEHLNDIIKHTWNLQTVGYIECRIDKKVVLLHRFLIKAHKNDEVDHKNRNKLNNLNDNLRILTHSQNQINKGKMFNNTSGVTGVTWDRARNKWKVMINYDKKTINLGRFDTLEEATKIRLEAEKKYHKEFIPIERKINKIEGEIN